MDGEWEYEHEASLGPGQPPMMSRGTHSVRSMGGLWILGEGRGEMPGGVPMTMTALITLGYDPEKKRFTWTPRGRTPRSASNSRPKA
jgi:hypothetical protein